MKFIDAVDQLRSPEADRKKDVAITAKRTLQSVPSAQRRKIFETEVFDASVLISRMIG